MTGISPPFLTSFDNNFFVMILPIPIPGDIATDAITFDLREGVYFQCGIPQDSNTEYYYFYYYTDYYNCPATSVQLFEDFSCITPLASTDISFAINPTVKDFDGVPRPVFNVNRANRLLEQYVYIQGTSGSQLKTVVEGLILVCGDLLSIYAYDEGFELTVLRLFPEPVD